MSSGWKRLYPKPAGSLPGGIVTQWGVALITVLILDLCRAMACHGRNGASGDRLHRRRSHRPGPELRRSDGRAGRSRGATGRDAAIGGSSADPTSANNVRRRRKSATGAIGAGQVTMDEALLLAGPSPETGRSVHGGRNLNSGNACAWKPWNGGAGPFAVRRWLRPTGNSTAPDHRRKTGAEPGPVEAIRAEGAAALAEALGTLEGCDHRA